MRPALPALLVLAACKSAAPTPLPPDGPITFEGSLTYTATVVGYDAEGPVDSTCTAEFTLVGEQAGTVECAECLWALAIEGTVVSDDCDEVPDGIGFTGNPPIYLGYWGAEAPLGASLFIEDPSSEPFGVEPWAALSGPLADLVPGGATFELDGTAISWSHGGGIRQFFGLLTAYQICATDGTLAEGSAPVVGSPISGSVDALGTADVYEIVGDAGAVVSASVEAPLGSTMDPSMTWVEPNGCAERSFDASFTCANGSSCPSATLTFGSTGTHRILVYPDGEITEEVTGAYELVVTGGTAVLVGDEVPLRDAYSVTRGNVQATGATSEALPAD